MFLINEFSLPLISLIEDNPHNGLPGANRTVYFGMNFINGDRIAFLNKGIKNIFTELLAFDDHFFGFGMNFRIKSS
jgi:hypothetical protein